MKSINKRIKEDRLDVRYLWDKPSVNGFPTKDSLMLTYVIKDCSSGTTPEDFDISFDIGVALKVPGDEPIQRIGKAIAYRNLNGLPYTIDSVSVVSLLNWTQDYFEFIDHKLCGEYRSRIMQMFKDEFFLKFIGDAEF